MAMKHDSGSQRGAITGNGAYIGKSTVASCTPCDTNRAEGTAGGDSGIVDALLPMAMDVEAYAQLELPPATPWYEPHIWPWTAFLESRADEISAELKLQLSAFSPWPDYLKTTTHGEDSSGKMWSVLAYKFYCHFLPQFAAAMPRTAAILDEIPFVTSAGFSLLPPGTHILPHRGTTDSVLRYHLGLLVPKDFAALGMRVDGATQHWRAGESLLFDDTFTHDAWNDSQETRVVMIIDILRPELAHQWDSICEQMHTLVHAPIRNVLKQHGHESAAPGYVPYYSPLSRFSVQ